MTNKTKFDKASEALQLSLQIQPILHGRDPELIGAALADLVSLFLVGFVTAEAIEAMLELHVKTVRELLPASRKQMLERQQSKGSA